MAHTKYYNKNNELIPSVTTVLSVINKPALVFWSNKMGLQGINTTHYVDETAIIGSLAHRMIECRNEGIEFSFDDEYTGEQFHQADVCVEKYLEWESYQNEFEPIGNELKLVSEKYGYGGTIDCLARLNGKLTLIDYKTCKSIWSEHKFQVSAYYNMLLENGYKVEQAVILRIGRNEEEDWFEYVPLTKKQITHGFRVFKSALKLYNEKKEFEKISKQRSEK